MALDGLTSRSRSHDPSAATGAFKRLQESRGVESFVDCGQDIPWGQAVSNRGRRNAGSGQGGRKFPARQKAGRDDDRVRLQFDLVPAGLLQHEAWTSDSLYLCVG